jgi:hypothetical protein
VKTVMNLRVPYNAGKFFSSCTIGGFSSLAVYCQLVSLGAKLLEIHDRYLFQLNTCDYSPYVTSSLTIGWVCRLQLLMALARAVILGYESRGTHDHILLSQILRARSPYFMSPRIRVDQL